MWKECLLCNRKLTQPVCWARLHLLSTRLSRPDLRRGCAMLDRGTSGCLRFRLACFGPSLPVKMSRAAAHALLFGGCGAPVGGRSDRSRQAVLAPLTPEFTIAGDTHNSLAVPQAFSLECMLLPLQF